MKQYSPSPATARSRFFRTFVSSPLNKASFMNPKGVIIKPSPYSVKETIDRLQRFLQQQGVTIYARIDQQTEVTNAGLHLAPLEFILFGKPKAGGPLMIANPLAALDLPLKIIAWEDQQQKVWLAYNDAAYVRERYDLPEAISAPLNLDPIVSKALQ
jgi:uncharacterized protein (DUF302 family)